jgi:hypothetical protein
VSEKLLLPAVFHHHCEARDEVGCLLSHRRGLVGEAPFDDGADLGEVRLRAQAEGIHHRAETWIIGRKKRETKRREMIKETEKKT